MIMQALGRNVEKIECAEIDWKGIKGEARGKLIAALESLKIKWERA
jgi:D-tyrosyl-tRNA(Tyr) deacylase